MSFEASQARLRVLPAEVGLSLGVLSGGTATTVAAAVPGCCACAAVQRLAAAAIQKNPDDTVKIFAYPGYMVGSEISKLINRGYQQFLKTSLGAPAQPSLPAGSDAAPEPLRPPSPANNPPPPYRGGPTSAQAPLPPTVFGN